MDRSKTPEDRAAWILTGGRSSRMGRDKALIEIDGRPLAIRIAYEASKCCPAVSLVGDPGLYGNLGLPVIPDNFPGAGPLAGIEAALSTTGAEWNLITACDMPELSLGIFEELFAAGTDCALPRYPAGTVEPLCAVYRKKCHAAIRRAVASGIRKVTDALRLLEEEGFQIQYFPVDSESTFANLNTPEDVRKYLNA